MKNILFRIKWWWLARTRKAITLREEFTISSTALMVATDLQSIKDELAHAQYMAYKRLEKKTKSISPFYTPYDKPVIFEFPSYRDARSYAIVQRFIKK